jgi:hypothetical protein
VNGDPLPGGRRVHGDDSARSPPTCRVTENPAAVFVIAPVGGVIVGSLLGTFDSWRGNMYRHIGTECVLLSEPPIRLEHKRHGFLQIRSSFLQRRTLRVCAGQLLDEPDVALGQDLGKPDP